MNDRQYIISRIKDNLLSFFITCIGVSTLLFFNIFYIATILIVIMCSLLGGAELSLWFVRKNLIKAGINPETLKYSGDKKE